MVEARRGSGARKIHSNVNQQQRRDCWHATSSYCWQSDQHVSVSCQSLVISGDVYIWTLDLLVVMWSTDVNHLLGLATLRIFICKKTLKRCKYFWRFRMKVLLAHSVLSFLVWLCFHGKRISCVRAIKIKYWLFFKTKSWLFFKTKSWLFKQNVIWYV